MWNLKKHDANELTYKQKETRRLREWSYGCWGKHGSGESARALPCWEWVTSKDHCAAHGALLDVTQQPGEGESGGEWMPVSVRLNCSAVRLKPSQHCELSMFFSH